MEEVVMLTNEASQVVEHNELEIYDEECGHLFTTSESFATREDAEDWVYAEGHKHKMYFKINSSKKNRVYLGCEREGKYVEHIEVEDEERINKRKRKSRGTKKSGCRFQVKLNLRLGRWLVSPDPKRATHNHKLGKYGNWHKSYSRMLAKQDEEIESLTNDNMKPKAILNRMYKNNPGLNLRKVNNSRVKINRRKRGSLSKMQLLMRMLSEKNYVHWERIEEDGSKALTDIVFAHHDAIKLLRKFPQVLLVDGTYSTNKFKLPLIEIIGVCSTGNNYHVAFAFVKNERKDNFLFVMESIRKMYAFAERVEVKDVKGPGVILTDRELACMNAVVEVFPKAEHFLCRRHISVDVRKHVATFAKLIYPGNTSASVSMANSFSRMWNSLVVSPTVEIFEKRLIDLEEKVKRFPSLIDYIHKTWLDPYRERFVSAWTDKLKHYGNLTTNRVEGAHSQLKDWFGSANGNLVTCFKKIDELVVLQIEEIKTQFEKSLAVHSHMTRYAVFRLLGGNLTHKAIDLLLEEGARFGDDCLCIFPITHGLPCKCRMNRLIKENKPIELGMVDKFWRTLDMEEDEEEVALTPSAKDMVEDAWVKYMAQTPSEASLYMTSAMLYEMTVPESCDLEEPKHVQPKGRPKNCLGARYKSAFEVEENSARRKMDASQREEDMDVNEEVDVNEEEEELEKGIGEGSVRGRGGRAGRSRGRGGRSVRGRGRGANAVSGRGKGRGANAVSGRGKGRGKGSGKSMASKHFPYGSEVPRCIWEFIALYLNVKPDGNCGFRAVAHVVYGDEERWDDVRRDLIKELMANRDFWLPYLPVEDVIERLDFHEAPGGNTKYWFSVLNMGLLVATVYQAALFIFSKRPLTFLPLRCDTELLANMPLKEYGLAYIESKAHFVVLGVTSKCPVPPLFCKPWRRGGFETTRHWAEEYTDRMNEFVKLEVRVEKSDLGVGVMELDDEE